MVSQIYLLSLLRKRNVEVIAKVVENVVELELEEEIEVVVITHVDNS